MPQRVGNIRQRPAVIGLNRASPLGRRCVYAGAITAASASPAGNTKAVLDLISHKLVVFGSVGTTFANSPWVGRTFSNVTLDFSNTAPPPGALPNQSFVTLAAWVYFSGAPTAFDGLVSVGNGSGPRISITTGGILRFTKPGIVDVNSTLAFASGVPYLAICSFNASSGAVNFLLKHLDTGQVEFNKQTSTGNFNAPGNSYGVTAGSTTNLAAWAVTPEYFGESALRKIAEKPWDALSGRSSDLLYSLLPGASSGGTLALAARTNSAARARAAASASAALAAIVKAQSEARAAAAGTAALAGKAESASEAKGAATGSAALTAKAPTQAKASGGLALGAILLAGRATAMMKARASAAVVAALSVVGSSKSRASGAATGTLALSGRSAGQSRTVGAINSGLTLIAGRAASMARAAGSALFTANLVGRSSAQAKASAASTNTLTLTARSTSAARSSGAVTGTLTLFGRAASIAKALATFAGFVNIRGVHIVNESLTSPSITSESLSSPTITNETLE